MDVSRVLQDVVLLERGVKQLYADAAREKMKDNAEVAKVLGLLARESETHAKEVEAAYGVSGKTRTGSEGVKSLLSVLGQSMAELRGSTKPVEVLRGGMKIEGHLEQLYRGLADNYETEESFESILLEKEESGLKPSQLFRKIAEDEKRHQQMLQALTPRIINADGT